MFKGPIFSKYETQEWMDLPATWKNAQGYWAYDYSGVIAIGYNASVIKTAPTGFASLLLPAFKNAVGLSNNPTSSNAGFSAVYSASLDNGGSLNNIQPGINYFKKLKQVGNYNPVEAGGNGDAPMATKTVLATLDWTYNQLSWEQDLKKHGINWKMVVPSGTPFAVLLRHGHKRLCAQPRRRQALPGVHVLPDGPEPMARRGCGPGDDNDDAKERHCQQGRGSHYSSVQGHSRHPLQCPGQYGQSAGGEGVVICSRLAT